MILLNVNSANFSGRKATEHQIFAYLIFCAFEDFYWCRKIDWTRGQVNNKINNIPFLSSKNETCFSENKHKLAQQRSKSCMYLA